MSSPTKPPSRGVPVGRIIIILAVFGLPGLIYLGARNLIDKVTLTTIPVVGEWQAASKHWRIVLHPDKTLVSSTGSSQPGASQEWTSGQGTYSVDYFGMLWVKLNNGKMYSAALSEKSPNRFDLIESGTDVPTAFQRVLQPEPKPAESEKASPDEAGPEPP